MRQLFYDKKNTKQSWNVATFKQPFENVLNILYFLPRKKENLKFIKKDTEYLYKTKCNRNYETM